MFTGLIKEKARVVRYVDNLLYLHATYRPKMGESIAINGVCLSVVGLSEGGFSVELSPETRSLIATEHLQGYVHIEPAMALGDRLDGHMVQGHVDCLGVVEHIEAKENGVDLWIELPEPFRKFAIPKGSIAIDGVSLTINEATPKGCRLTIIPITWRETLLNTYAANRRVNVETDLFARYVYHLFKEDTSLQWSTIDRILASY